MFGTVLRRDELLRDIIWPDMEKIDVPDFRDCDHLLVCGGFEERAVSILRRICTSRSTGQKSRTPSLAVVLIRYLPEHVDNRNSELRSICQNAGLQVNEVTYNRQNPTDIGEKLLGLVKGDGRVYIDISGMSRLLIVQALVAFLNEQCRSVSILYAEAEEYPPSEDKFQRDMERAGAGPPPSYISSGIFEIAVLPELSSVSMFGEAIRLVAFPSFDPSQLTNLVEELQPTYANVIHGIPPSRDNRWRKQAIERLNERTLAELQGKTDHEASTLDYRGSLKSLLHIYAQRSMFDRLVVAPTGSKMQAVAVGLVRAVLRDVQIVYPTPKTFVETEEYTIGIRQLYQLNLPTQAIADAIGHNKTGILSSRVSE